MKPAVKNLLHMAGVLFALLLLLGVPAYVFGAPLLSRGGADAVSQASIPLPDTPSGDFLVLIRADKHEAYLDDWREFFTDGDFGVIFDDIHCLTAAGDVSGQGMAERYQLQLPEHQMTLRQENATLLVSKAEAGLIDVAVLSKEMAESLGFKGSLYLKVIEVKGAAE